MKAALGRLYWDEERAFWSDVNVIRLALEGNSDYLKSLFGSGKDTATVNTTPPRDAKGRPLTLSAASFDAVFDPPHAQRHIRRKQPGTGKVE